MLQLLAAILAGIAAFCSLISLAKMLKDEPRLKAFFKQDGEHRKLSLQRSVEFNLAVSVKNVGSVSLEVFKVTIRFPRHFKIRISQQIGSLKLPIDVMGPPDFYDYPRPRVQNTEIIFQRRGILNWNLGGGDHFDFPICGETPEKTGEYKVRVEVQTTRKTFFDELKVKAE